MGNYVSTKDTKDNRFSVGFREAPATAITLLAHREGIPQSGFLARLVLKALRNDPEYAQFIRSHGLEV